MVTRHGFLGRAGEAYVGLCVILAMLALLPQEPSDLAYYGLFVVTLPVALVAATVSYLGGVLIFGLEQDGLLARGAHFILWVALATAQMVAIRRLIRMARQRPAAPPSH